MCGTSRLPRPLQQCGSTDTGSTMPNRSWLTPLDAWRNTQGLLFEGEPSRVDPARCWWPRRLIQTPFYSSLGAGAEAAWPA